MLVLRIADYVKDVSAILCADYLSTGKPTEEDAVKRYLPPGLYSHMCNKFNQRPTPPPAHAELPDHHHPRHPIPMAETE